MPEFLFKREFIDQISFLVNPKGGYGDFYPVSTIGKGLASLQALLFLFFVVLFLNFFSTRIKSKGYFDHKKPGKPKQIKQPTLPKNRL